MIYVGIDPGVRNAGVAACDGGGNLLGAMWARTDTREALAHDVADAVLVALLDRLKVGFVKGIASQGAVVGIEWPELVDGRARGAADTSDVVMLAYAVGRIEEALRRELVNVHVMRVSVGAWKRNVSTDVLEARLGLAPSVGLSPAEHACIAWPAPSYRHNVVDAIALARWLAAWPWKNPSKNINDFGLL